MKKLIFTLLLSAFVSVGLFARHGTISISSNNYERIIVEIDGFIYNDNPRFQVRARNLSPGNHYIRVFKLVPRIRGRGFIEREIYCGDVYVDPYAEVFCSINPYGGFAVNKVYVDRPYAACLGSGYNFYSGFYRYRGNGGNYYRPSYFRNQNQHRNHVHGNRQGHNGYYYKYNKGRHHSHGRNHYQQNQGHRGNQGSANRPRPSNGHGHANRQGQMQNRGQRGQVNRNNNNGRNHGSGKANHSNGGRLQKYSQTGR